MSIPVALRRQNTAVPGTVEQGKTSSATRDANEAAHQRASAADAGRLRVSVVGSATLLLDGIAVGGLALRRRQRRRKAMVGPVPAEAPSRETEPVA